MGFVVHGIVGRPWIGHMVQFSSKSSSISSRALVRTRRSASRLAGEVADLAGEEYTSSRPPVLVADRWLVGESLPCSCGPNAGGVDLPELWFSRRRREVGSGVGVFIVR
jgi:hypothetical protein